MFFCLFYRSLLYGYLRYDLYTGVEYEIQVREGWVFLLWSDPAHQEICIYIYTMMDCCAASAIVGFGSEAISSACTKRDLIEMCSAHTCR